MNEQQTPLDPQAPEQRPPADAQAPDQPPADPFPTDPLPEDPQDDPQDPDEPGPAGPGDLVAYTYTDGEGHEHQRLGLVVEELEAQPGEQGQDDLVLARVVELPEPRVLAVEDLTPVRF